MIIGNPLVSLCVLAIFPHDDAQCLDHANQISALVEVEDGGTKNRIPLTQAAISHPPKTQTQLCIDTSLKKLTNSKPKTKHQQMGPAEKKQAQQLEQTKNLAWPRQGSHFCTPAPHPSWRFMSGPQ